MRVVALGQPPPGASLDAWKTWAAASIKEIENAAQIPGPASGVSAANVLFTPPAGMTSTDVQAAIEELYTLITSVNLDYEIYSKASVFL